MPKTSRRLDESHALRALNKRQTSVKKFEKWIKKCQAQQVAAPHLDHIKWNSCIACKWNVKRTQYGRKLQKFFKKKLVKSPEKRTQEFLLIYFIEKKSNCQVWNRRRLWKFVVMDFEIFIEDRWRLKVLSSFGEHFCIYAVKVKISSNLLLKVSCRRIWWRSWIGSQSSWLVAKYKWKDLLVRLDTSSRTCSEVNVAD